MIPSAPRSTGPRTLHRTIPRCLLGLALGALGALSASGDWLVMEDGSRLETQGAWSVEGRRVVFTLPNGTLSAVRARDVDLEASRALTDAEAARGSEAAEPDEEERPEPAWTFTNADIPEAAAIQEAIEIEPLVGAEGFALQDIVEEVDASGENLVVRGTLINDADLPVTGLAVRVLIRSAVDGGTLDVARATVNSTALSPRTATRFNAIFDGMVPGQGVIQVEVEVAEDTATPFILRDSAP